MPIPSTIPQLFYHFILKLVSEADLFIREAGRTLSCRLSVVRL